MGYFDFKLQKINLCKIILQALIKFDIKKTRQKMKKMLPCKFSSMPVLSGHTDRVWDKSYMYCGNSHSLFILKGQHSLPAYHCCSCCRACYGIRLTGNDFLPKRSGTEHSLERKPFPHCWWLQSQGSSALGAGHGVRRRRRQDSHPGVSWQLEFHPKKPSTPWAVTPIAESCQPATPASDGNGHSNLHAVQPLAPCKRGVWGCW